jgi:aryl-alcohol dehydrogenase-like predicted oxidoreductase
MRALWTSDAHRLARFDCLQPHYNLVHRQEYERELEDVCVTYGLGVIPYSPLGGGFLTGKYRRGEKPPASSRGETSNRIQSYMQDDRSWAVLEALEAFASKRGRSISQVALAWLLGRGSITSPIIGPRSIAQLEDNLGAIEVKLEAEEIDKLEETSISL